MFDTHAHLYAEEYGADFEKIIIETLSEGIWFNNIGTGRKTSEEVVRIANLHQGVFAAVGLHPGSVEQEEFDHNFFRELARDSKVVGIGECGLDYYRLGADSEATKDLQKQIFEKQIDIAKELNKVLIVHTRAIKDTDDAYQDTLEIFRKRIAAQTMPKFLVHSFTASWRLCSEFLALGGYIALNGIITFDKTGVLEEVIKNVPLDRLVLETDAPYLAPAPFRGKQNLPKYLRFIAEHIAKVRNVSTDEIEKITDQNTRELFGIK